MTSTNPMTTLAPSPPLGDDTNPVSIVPLSSMPGVVAPEPEESSAFLLWAYDGMTTKEIAAALDVPLRTVQYWRKRYGWDLRKVGIADQVAASWRFDAQKRTADNFAKLLDALVRTAQENVTKAPFATIKAFEAGARVLGVMGLEAGIASAPRPAKYSMAQSEDQEGVESILVSDPSEREAYIKTAMQSAYDRSQIERTARRTPPRK